MALENQKFSNYIDENSLPEDWGGGGSSGISKTYITTVGDNSTTEFNINHNFGTDNVIVMVTDLLTKENIMPEWKKIDNDNLTVIFSEAPSPNSYQISVHSFNANSQFWSGTEEELNAITEKDDSVLYLIEYKEETN